jgi:N12 class adenine-specific DNA methylase
MHPSVRTLSIDDQKAVDVCLDHSVSAGKTGMTRIAVPVQQKRLKAVARLLSLLGEMPALDLPEDLVARTMARIDLHDAGKTGPNPLPPAVNTAQLH